MEHRNHDIVTGWFIRRKAANEPAQDANDGKQQKGKGRQAEAAPERQQPQHKRAEAKQQKQGVAVAAAGPSASNKKPSNPVIAAAAAVAAAAAEKKAELKATSAPPAADKKANGGTAAAGAAEKKAAVSAAVPDNKATQPAASDKNLAAPAPPAATEKKGASPTDGATDDRKSKAASSSSADSDSDDEHPLSSARREQQRQRQRRRGNDVDEDAEYRPRVLAYSDSDSDVESHFKRVKTHLMPPSEEEVAERVAAEAAETAAVAAAEAVAAEVAKQQTKLRRLRGAVGDAAGAAAQAVAPHLTPGLAARAAGLALLGRTQPRAMRAAGLLGVAVQLAGAAAAKAGLDLGARLPRPLLAAGEELGHLGKAAVALSAVQLLRAKLRDRQRRRKERLERRRRQLVEEKAAARTDAEAVAEAEPVPTPGRLQRRRSAVNIAALGASAELGAAIERRQPQTAAEWAVVYGAEMREMRRMLQENEVELSPDRFDGTNAELLRFAKACGLLTANSAEQRAAALEAGVSRVVLTVEWTARQRFMTDRELRRWERLVAWKAHDASGRPILLARVGRAQQLIKPERYDDFANALLTLVHRGLTTQLSNLAGPAEQMVVVLDCRGGSSMGLTRHMALLKRLAVTLNQHYPDRLHRLHLLELPLLLRWVLHGVMPLLHPTTRGKLIFSSINDPELPVTVANLSKRRSVMKPGSLKRNISNCSFPSSGDATPSLLSPQQTFDARTMPAMAAAAASEGAQASASGGGEASGSQGCAASCGAGGMGSAAGPGSGSGQQQQEQQQLGDDDVPHTPPPTLKAPQSPREVLLAKPRQLILTQQQNTAASGSQPRAREAAPKHPAAPASGDPAAKDARPAAGQVATVSAAASAAMGITSHAVPWSCGMQSPTGLLSRDPSYGEEPVPAARAKAAADAVRELEGWQHAQQQHAAGSKAPSQLDGNSGSAGSMHQLGQQLLQRSGAAVSHSGLLPLHPSQPAIAAMLGASSASSSGSARSWLGGLLPGQWGTATKRAHPQTPAQQQVGCQPALCLPLAGMVASSSEGGTGGSTPRSPQGSRTKKGGLVDLPERPVRVMTPGRGRAPRKSSLRRSESADSLHTRVRLGSHPLRRQSSVSWAEELESVKEIMPRDSSPVLPSRVVHAAASAANAVPQLVLLACIFLVVVAALMQQLLLGLPREL